MSFTVNISWKDALQIAELALGVAGVYLSVRAAWKLFKQIQGLAEIGTLDEPIQKTLKADDLYRDLAIRINNSIKEANALNTGSHKDDKKRWMNRVVVGSVLAILSLIASFISSYYFSN